MPECFRILSLDGGGIRGAFGAAYLAELERMLGSPLHRYFDLVAGTSTGAIIGSAIAAGKSMVDVSELYRALGREVFGTRQISRANQLWKIAIQKYLRSKTLEITADQVFVAKYASGPLQSSLERFFGKETLETSKTRLLIPAVNLTTGHVNIFKSPHHPLYWKDRSRTFVDVILAATAAPTFFQPHSIERGSAFVDGGIWANNPTVIAYIEALRIMKNEPRPDIDPVFDPDQIRILSVGTGKVNVSTKVPKETGVLWWGSRLTSMVFAAQAESCQNMISYLGPQHFTRIDFDIPQGDWGLDCVENIEELIHQGQEKAAVTFKDVRDALFEQSCSAYVPFDPPGK
jgi:patatin-like phospholipase/acyl hydrolase